MRPPALLVVAVLFSLFVAQNAFAIAPAAPQGLGFNVVKQIGTALNINPPAGATATAQVVSLITDVVTFLLGIAGTVALIGMIVGGFRYMLSFGNEQKAESGKKMLLYSIVGLFIVGASFFIVVVIENLITGNL